VELLVPRSVCDASQISGSSLISLHLLHKTTQTDSDPHASAHGCFVGPDQMRESVAVQPRLWHTSVKRKTVLWNTAGCLATVAATSVDSGANGVESS